MLQRGDRVGDWIVECDLAEGGMGAVYRVHSMLSQRVRAALKVMKPFMGEEARARFVREAEALMSLRHAAIVRPMGVGEDPDRGLTYLVMELAVGETLRSRLRRGPMSLEDALRVFRRLASALEHAHAAGISHRDVKPDNIVLCDDGGVRLVDFGIAAAEEWAAITTSGHVGTLAYLPPETFRHGRAEPKDVDVYGFGLCLYEVLTGHRPFPAARGLQGPASVAVIGAEKLKQEPFDPGDVYPEALREVVRAATDGDPARRPTMATLRRRLDEISSAAFAGPEALAAAAPFEPDPTLRVSDPRRQRLARLWRGARAHAAARWAPLRAHLRPLWSRRRLLIAGAAAGAVLILFATAVFATRRWVASAGGPPGKPEKGEVWTNPVDGLEYAWVPAGSFKMGCTPGDDQCDPAQWPTFSVSLGQGFWMARTEVTVGAYKRFADEKDRALPPAPGFNPKWEHEDHPMLGVNWDEAREYCRWAGGRLPTEAEWEWAARGGTVGALHPWGSAAPECRKESDSGARFDDGGACRSAGTAPVASHAANGYGLFDLAGNAWEWCEDTWRSHRGGQPGPEVRRDRVLRGGSWVNDARYMRISVRSSWPARRGSDFIGFRCLKADARE